MYLLSRKERRKIQKFIDEQLRKRYIRYYNSRLSDKSKKELYIEFIQENSIEFQV